MTNVNEAPSFATATASRFIAENTAANTDIGDPFTATDVDANTTLAYILEGRDAAAFSIDSTNGQLRTSAPLDYETKSSYLVSVSVSDGNGGSDSIAVTINVTDVDETPANRAPTFTDGSSITRPIAENSNSGTDIGSAIAATDADDDTLTYTLDGTDAASFTINSTNGQLKTKAALDFETKTSYSVRITVSDSELTDTIDVTINVTNVNEAPSFATATASRFIAENTAANTDIGDPFTATDVDANTTLTYTLGGADAGSFSINSTNGQLRTSAALDYETKNEYTVTVSVSDGNGGTDSITVTINVTNVNEIDPPLSERTPQVRDAIVAAVPGVNNADDVTVAHLAAITQLNLSDQSITSLKSGDFNELPALTTLYLESNSISDISALADLPALTMLSLWGNSISDISALAGLTALEELNLWGNSISDISALAGLTALKYLYLSGNSISDISALEGLTALEELNLSGNSISDISTLADLTALEELNLSGNSISDISTLAGLTALTDLYLNGNSISNISALAGLTALTDLYLKSNPISNYGPLRRLLAAIDGIEDHPGLTLDINIPPLFTEGTDTRRSVAENTASGQNIGDAVSATDADNDTLTYTLSGTDASSFTINSTNGQLRTSAALDYEAKTTYSVTVEISDGNGGSDSIDVTINVSNVNEAPSFATTTATRTIAENKASTNIGTAVTATDVDANTTLTYTLSGTDAASFSIVSTNGRLRTRAALNYETKTSYTVTITVSDSELTDTIDVTIDVTDVYEPIIHRTQQVQDAIVAAVPGVNHADYVTVAHLAAITNLNLSDKSITSLKSGDFNELPALTNLSLWGNSISDISALAGLPALKYLYLWDNSISDISVLAGLTKLTRLNLFGNSISDISALAGLTALTELHLDGNSISNISTLAGLTKLTRLNLSGNSISDISALAGLTALTNLNLSGTSISDISTLAGLTALEVLYLGGNSISDISALADLTGLTNLNLSDNSISNISVLAGLTGLTTLNLGGNPISNYDPLRRLLVAIDGIEDHPGLTLDINIPPVFTEGTDTTRSVAEYTPSDQDIGDPVSATDVDSYFLIYSLEGPDADAFSIDAYTGQLQTSAALDYRTKRSYSVTVSVSDGNGGTDSITVTINVTYVNRAPSFTDGSTTTRLVAENTASGQNIGTPVAATDADDDTLSYSLEGPDAASFRIVSASGQLRTYAALDYDTKSSYSVTVSVSDGNGGTDSIAVTINVTSVNEGSITAVNQRTQQVQDAIMREVYYVDNADDVTPAHLAEITRLQLDYKDITSLKSGDFSGLTGLTYLDLDGNSISDISALKGLTTLTRLYLWGNSISDISALKGLTTLTNLKLSENSISDISVLAGLPALKHLYLSGNSISNVSALEGLTTLTYLELSGNPISDYAPLRRLLAAIDAIEDHPGLRLDINIPPLFTEGTDTRRSVAEYTPSGHDIGDPVSATDVDSYYLTYTLEGPDADTFSIDASTGQLQTSAALNYRTKRSYSVTVSVSDGYDGTDSIAVRIYVTDVNEAHITPVDRRTQEVQDAIMRAVRVDNAADVTYTDLAGINSLYLSAKGITSLKSGDFSGLPALTRLDLSDNSISNISALSGLTELTELNLFSNSISNISALSGLTKLIDLDLSENSISNISALRGLPALTELNLSENSISNISALERLTGLTTLNLSGNPISNYEPLRKLLAAIDGIEGHRGLTLDINIPPVFTDGTYTTRAVAEYTLSEKHIGDPVSATDANENDSLTYTLVDKDLEGTDAASFNIDSTTGQLLTLAPLNYRTKRSYSVTVSVSDGNGGTDRITVRINVTDVDESRITPVNQRTQQVQDAIVSRVWKVDNADDVTVGHLAAIEDLSLSYDEITSLKSGDFSGLTGLTTLYLTGNSISDISALADLTALENLYLSDNFVSDISALEGITSLTELYLSGNSISDVSALEGLTNLTRLDLWGNPISDYAPLRRLETAIQNADNSISIDINITNNPPQFTDGGSTTRSIAENTESYTDIGEPISATDADPSDNLTYDFAPDRFGSSDARLFSIDYSTGQLRTSEDLDYEEQTSYTVVVDVSDFSDGLDRITVTINITDVAGAAPSAETSPIIPNKTALLTNFPNPFNPETWIPYQLAKPAEVTLTIYDIRGVVVRELKLGHQPAGVYHNRSRAIHWDGRNAFGEKVATGVYFYTLKAGDFTATRKLLIRK